MCDGNHNITFKLRPMVFYTINDFPTYENLSGYSVKGHHTCPICEFKTSYMQMKHGKRQSPLDIKDFSNLIVRNRGSNINKKKNKA